MNIKSRIFLLIIVIIFIAGLILNREYNEQDKEQIISMVETKDEQDSQEVMLPTKPPILEDEEPVETIVLNKPQEIISSMEPISGTDEEIVVENEETVVENEDSNSDLNLISLGEFSLTAYCSCEICCDEYALNRPVDENGNEIVYGAIGERLTAGVSIAVDPKVIPYRSKVIIDGQMYIAQDTGGAIKGNRIDVYHNSHEEALKFAVRTTEVFIIVED